MYSTSPRLAVFAVGGREGVATLVTCSWPLHQQCRACRKLPECGLQRVAHDATASAHLASQRALHGSA